MAAGTITLPKSQLIDNRTEPFTLQEAPFVSQYFLGYMSTGLDWSTPTLLFIERFGCEERALPPDMAAGWVVRAEPAGQMGLTNSFYLNPATGQMTGEEEFDFEQVWKYKNACTYPTLERAVLLVNWALNLLPASYYEEKRAQPS